MFDIVIASSEEFCDAILCYLGRRVDLENCSRISGR
jgi:hypothetical protein